MKDKEPKLNASGYYDEPCYKAVTASPKPGEIWTHAATGYHMLIVANLNGVCSTLRLTDVERDGCIPVTGRTLMFATPIMLGYSFESTLGQYVKSIKADEFEKVKRGIASALGIESYTIGITDPGEHINVHIHNEQVKALEEQRDKLLEEIGGYGETIKKQAYELQAKEKNIIMLGESLAKVEREADKAEIYKDMYMTLLDKVISARGEA